MAQITAPRGTSLHEYVTKYDPTLAYLLDEWSDQNECGPEEVLRGEGRTKRLWNCPKHGEYEMKVAFRVKAYAQCQKCVKEIPSKTTLATYVKEHNTHLLFLLDEWSPANTVTPDEVSRNNNKSFLWRCFDHGNYIHEYETTVSGRVSSGYGCNLCANKIVIAGINDVATTDPWVLRELSSENIVDVTAVGRGYRDSPAVWTCETHGDYPATISDRVGKGSGCPECGQKKGTAFHRTPKKGNSIAEFSPHLVEEWSDKNEKTPWDYNRSCKDKVWWKCPEGHDDYEATISDRCNSGSGCSDMRCVTRKISEATTSPDPGNSVAECHPELIVQWSDQNDTTPWEHNRGTQTVAYWKCMKEKNHPDYPAQILSRTGQKSGCPKCYSHHSEPERIIYERLQEKQIELEDEWKIYQPAKKTKIGGRKPDIIAEHERLGLKVVIEFDGCYYHSEKFGLKTEKDLWEKDIKQTADFLHGGANDVIRIRNSRTSLDVGNARVVWHATKHLKNTNTQLWLEDVAEGVCQELMQIETENMYNEI